MLIGVPKEIKPQENRVGMTPASVRELTHHGHAVLMETGELFSTVAKRRLADVAADERQEAEV